MKKFWLGICRRFLQYFLRLQNTTSTNRGFLLWESSEGRDSEVGSAMGKKPSPSFLSSLSLKWINFLVILTIWLAEMVVAQNTSTVPVKVGVVLDMDRDIGKFGLTCISMALSDLYSSHAHYKTRLVLHTRNSSDSVVTAASAGKPYKHTYTPPPMTFFHYTKFSLLPLHIPKF